MARTEQDIYDEIDAERQGKDELAVYNSPSSVALFRLWQWVVAKVIHIFEKNFDNHKEEVQAIADAAPVHNPQWYVDVAKKFQYGDVLQDDGTYALIDEAKQIVKHAALVEGDDLILKASKVDGDPLNAAPGTELDAFTSYMNKKKDAGNHLVILSLNPDLLKAEGTIYYNAEYTEATVKASLDAEVDAYLSGLAYNGRVYTKKFDDAIQRMTGYVDHNLTLLQASQAASINWADIPLTATGRYYTPLAGTIKMDQPLSAVLIFKPVVANP